MDNVNVSDPERCSFKGGVCPISGPAPLQPRLLHFILQNSFQISFNQCPNIENHNTETMVGKQRIQVWFRLFFLCLASAQRLKSLAKNSTKPLDMCGAGLNESWICKTIVLMCKVGNEKQFSVVRFNVHHWPRFQSCCREAWQKKTLRSVPVLLCLMRANRLEWNHEKCACDQQGSNALVMVFSFKLSTETRDMRRSQTKPAVHCFAGGRFMLPWMTQNDSHIVLTFFFSYPRDPFALDCHRHLPILKYGTVCMTNFQPAAPPRPRRAQGSPSQSEGFASSWIFGLLFTYGLWHLWREMTRTNLKIGQ